ncbi:MAG: hypothetical protein US40_C0002G0101 [Candidatus Roizmanbacteria bacterium GW2011_GWC2_37_13]|uniref:Uncharacterized protein n=1 Tax=Candidatus Roizmanbacteria bacterium GW2011_GWC2_37_13 TaxID=1618486 RepID=A0A0G0G977_9BACT|nr:MAG: hypothetical protein US38_C0006G0101 [Candidatus Roizmanbacteria bacterium GW2011_GWC1_37_12]KKQ26567.1 MAG: hypothetical protein US40_C0002G0101 [Candidatus Roizmanbacteria bacterium GW2011_GWC2_37_13]
MTPLRPDSVVTTLGVIPNEASNNSIISCSEVV